MRAVKNSHWVFALDWLQTNAASVFIFQVVGLSILELASGHVHFVHVLELVWRVAVLSYVWVVRWWRR